MILPLLYTMDQPFTSAPAAIGISAAAPMTHDESFREIISDDAVARARGRAQCADRAYHTGAYMREVITILGRPLLISIYLRIAAFEALSRIAA